MRNEYINTKIINLWNSFLKNDKEVYAPLFYDKFNEGSLLFVGLNPSFSVRGFKTILRDTKYQNIDPVSFLKWSNISSDIRFIDDCIDMENISREKYTSYFKPSKDIAKIVGLSWEHIDLFLYRDTKQKKFTSRIIEKGKLNAFGTAQLNFFKEILNTIKPRCIVIANAFGSEVIQGYFGKNISWDEGNGFHWFGIDGKKVPIFFSSMLTGQRALDRWSRERLVWHIKRAMG